MAERFDWLVGDEDGGEAVDDAPRPTYMHPSPAETEHVSGVTVR